LIEFHFVVVNLLFTKAGTVYCMHYATKNAITKAYFDRFI